MGGVSEGRKIPGNSVWAQGPRRERQGTSDRELENQLGQGSPSKRKGIK